MSPADSPTPASPAVSPRLRLRRVRAGEYQTLDGRFTLLLDPQSGGEPGGWGYRSWLVYDARDKDAGDWCPVALRGFDRHSTLRDARERLAAELNPEKPDAQ